MGERGVAAGLSPPVTLPVAVAPPGTLMVLVAADRVEVVAAAATVVTLMKSPTLPRVSTRVATRKAGV